MAGLERREWLAHSDDAQRSLPEAALGYWIKTQHPDQQDSEQFRLVIVHADASHLPHGLQISEVQALIIRGCAG
jgi:hypothetical protein